jgi:hypothetical protein
MLFTVAAISFAGRVYFGRRLGGGDVGVGVRAYGDLGAYALAN